MNDPTSEGGGGDALRTLLQKHGPEAVFESIADVCAQVARSGVEEEALWESAAEAAREALALLGEEESENDDEGESEGGPDSVNGAHAPAPCEPDTPTEPVNVEPTEAPKRTKMAKEDQLGPRPPMATHWRCRRVEDDGKKSTLLFHDDGCGIAVCEWPIRSCAPDMIRERWGGAGGAFVVQFIHADENGQRRPCGRSRVLHLMPPPLREERADPAKAIAVLPMAPQFLPPNVANGDDSFRQMLSLLAYMQDRDEKARTAAREEAKIAIERLRADNELQMERERIASKERLAQLELSAKAAGRTLHAPGFDTDLLAQRIGDAVGAKLEEVYANGDDEDEPTVGGNPAPAAPPDALAKILEILQPLAQAAGPLLAQRLFDGTPPGVANPSPPLRVIDGGNHGAQ